MFLQMDKHLDIVGHEREMKHMLALSAMCVSAWV